MMMTILSSISALPVVLAQATEPSGSTTEAASRTIFDWGSLPPLWVIFLVILPLVTAFSFWIYSREPTQRSRGFWWLPAGLRTLVILAILVFLARPVNRHITYRTQDPRLLVLVDDSLSMGVVDRYSDREAARRIEQSLDLPPGSSETLSRHELVRRLLSTESEGGGVLGRLGEKMRLALHTFAANSRQEGTSPRGAPADQLPVLASMEARKGDERVQETRIGDSVLESLDDVREPGTGSRDHGVVGVVLITDGQSTGGAIQPAEMALKLRQQGIPLLTVGVGNPDPPKNIRVTHLDVSDTVLVGDRVTFDATVESEGEGVSERPVRVELLLDGEVVETEQVELVGNGIKQQVRIEHRPQRQGDFTVSVRVEVLEGELFEDDNIFGRPLKVLEEKIKVLYVEGPPRKEYRFLKNSLIRDPTMEAQVFLLWADQHYRQPSSPGLPPLVRFPETEEELFPYHVIILGDVLPTGGDTPDKKLTRKQLELIQRFVADAGGGVIFIAGDQANPRLYRDTPLEPLLPVEIPEADRTGVTARIFERPFNVKLNPAQKDHPILRLDNDPEVNRRLWENDDGIEENHLPGFYRYFQAYKLKAGALALAHHPDDEHPIYGKAIIYATQNYGKGRVFYTAVDQAWRWRPGVDNLYLYRFYGQAVRFVSTGRLLGQTPRYNLVTDKRVYTIGEKILLDARVFDANMKPVTEPEILSFHSVKGREEGPVLPITLEQYPANGPGAYRGNLIAGQLGTHEFWLGSEVERLAFKTVTVEVPPLEYRNPRMNREGLVQLATLSEGKYYELHQFDEVVEYLKSAARPREIPVDETQNDLWDESWVLLLFTGLISTEWILRKVLKLQ